MAWDAVYYTSKSYWYMIIGLLAVYREGPNSIS